MQRLLDLPLPENDFTEKLEPQFRKSALEALMLDCLRAAAREAAEGTGLRVGVDNRNRKVGVGDGVMDGVRLGTVVSVGVSVGGMAAAVCEKAACAVCTTMVLTVPGCGAPTCGPISVDTSQLSSTAQAAASSTNPRRTERGLLFVAQSPRRTEWKQRSTDRPACGPQSKCWGSTGRLPLSRSCHRGRASWGRWHRRTQSQTLRA